MWQFWLNFSFYTFAISSFSVRYFKHVEPHYLELSTIYKADKQCCISGIFFDYQDNSYWWELLNFRAYKQQVMHTDTYVVSPSICIWNVNGDTLLTRHAIF